MRRVRSSRVRSSVTGRFVKAIVGKRSPRETVTELVERPRVDDGHIAVTLTKLDVEPGDLIVAKIPGHDPLRLEELGHIRRELELWARRNEVRAQVLVIGDGLELGASDAPRRLEHALALLVDLEEAIAEQNGVKPSAASGLELTRLNAYAQLLEEGVSAVRLALQDPPAVDVDHVAEEASASA